MKALFLIFHGFAIYNIGISKKIQSQIHALQQCGLDVKLCYLKVDPNGYHKRMLDNEVLENYGRGFSAKIRKRIRHSGIAEYISENNIQLLYIRSFHNANPFLIHFLKKLNQTGVKTVLEIPTYPYDQEYKNASLTDRLGLFFDKLFRHHLAKQIFRIVTYSDEKIIFGTPAINISNGIDFNQIRMKTKTNADPNRFFLIAVAEIHFWHGFDRILTGLAEYYRDQHSIKVFLDIVGDGVQEEVMKLQSIVIRNSLQDYVVFQGAKSGEELDNLFEKADMGIASLGRHRTNITHIKPLKNREYAARGIPFIYSEIDDDFEKMPYIMKAPADDSPLNINQMVDFFHKNRFNPSEIRKTISNMLSWEVQMSKVVNAVF